MTLESIFYPVPKTSLGHFASIYWIVLYIFVISGGVQMIVYLTYLTTLGVVSMGDTLMIT
ncbi:hypothetical protein MTR67_044777 [Solanum verrucosum]|uniref:Uncharacterized protein n=1 Tax=Solanum verrucosum TaxID=315347 RepID=A0AAF0ZT69_SOLVR|nr:hypothetical protein MTR67_044777 [Solanum verrucosum]